MTELDVHTFFVLVFLRSIFTCHKISFIYILFQLIRSMAVNSIIKSAQLKYCHKCKELLLVQSFISNTPTRGRTDLMCFQEDNILTARVSFIFGKSRPAQSYTSQRLVSLVDDHANRLSLVTSASHRLNCIDPRIFAIFLKLRLSVI